MQRSNKIKYNEKLANQQAKNRSYRSPRSDAEGFALPLVIIIGTFLMISGFAMLARTVGAFRGSIRNSQQTHAQENAERGVERMLQQLNNPRYRYLWVNCYRKDNTFTFDTGNSCGQTSIIGGWNNAADDHAGNNLPIFNGPNCAATNANSYSDGLKTTESIAPTPGSANEDSPKANRGKWVLEKYTFLGNPFTGGRGILQVRGTRTNQQGGVMATAVIEHHVQVQGKPCNKTITDTHEASAFPGLLAKEIDLQNSDVIGGAVANVYCTGCADTNEIQRVDGNSIVDGQLVAGELQLPPVPRFPTYLRSHVVAGDLVASSTEEIRIEPPPGVNQSFHPKCIGCSTTHIKNENPDQNPDNKPMCAKDADGISHCLIDNITLKGQGNLVVDTFNGTRPVRIYLEGDLENKGGGNPNDPVTGDIQKLGGGPLDLAIFSTQTSCATVGDQEINIAGTSSLEAFIYAPCATVNINGGANNAICTTEAGNDFEFDGRTKNVPLLPCYRGDINGAVWAGKFDAGGQNAEITVPRDLNDQLVNTFGEDFSVGASDFVGIGVPEWTSYQR